MKKITLILLSVILPLSSSTLADYDYADSPEFALNLLTLPVGAGYDYADSSGFNLDLYPVNRGWADSNEFGYNYSSQQSEAEMATNVSMDSDMLPAAETFEEKVRVDDQSGNLISTPIAAEVPQIGTPQQATNLTPHLLLRVLLN